MEEGAGEGQAHQGKGQGGDQIEEDAGIGGLIRRVLFLLPQGPGEQGVHAYAGTAADGEHEVLQGEGQGDGVQGVLSKFRHPEAVHHVVQSLKEHGGHHGQGHGGQKPSHGHDAHLVFTRRDGGGRSHGKLILSILCIL